MNIFFNQSKLLQIAIFVNRLVFLFEYSVIYKKSFKKIVQVVQIKILRVR